MRQIIAAAIVLLMLLFLSPWLRAEENTPETDAALQPLQTEQPNPASGAGSDAAHTVRLWDGSAVQTLTAAEYLPGVVRGEMPATFEEEALKAQAAAERTYLYYRMTAAPKDSHPDADVCTDPGCCTAWLSEADARAKWGGKFDQYEAKVQQAVADTDGQVVLYDGAPIMAVFHSSSAGATAASGDVWAAELPYLVSVIMLRIALAIPAAIGSEVFITYIGLGLSVETPSLGNLINDGRKVMMQAGLRYQLLYPTLILSFVTIAFYLIGNAFSDAADPKNHLQ